MQVLPKGGLVVAGLATLAVAVLPMVALVYKMAPPGMENELRASGEGGRTEGGGGAATRRFMSLRELLEVADGTEPEVALGRPRGEGRADLEPVGGSHGGGAVADDPDRIRTGAGTATSVPQVAAGKSAPGRLEESAAARSFPVPAIYASLPTPMFVIDEPVYELKVGGLAAGGGGTATGGGAAGLETEAGIAKRIPEATARELEAVAKAGRLFFDGLAAAPTDDPETREYADWWDASRQRSEDYLRAMLGWPRYNALSALAAQRWTRENGPAASSEAE